MSFLRLSTHRCSSQRLYASTQFIRSISTAGNQNVYMTRKKMHSRTGVLTKSSRSIFSPLFTSLLIIGLGLTAYGIHGVYHEAMTMWPQEIREDLRNGLLAKRKGDSKVAASYLFRAWEQAKRMPLHAFGEDPRLKTTGIAISLAGILEEARNKEEAYQVYQDALLQIIHDPSKSQPPSSSSLTTESLEALTISEKIRAISIAYKLGELAQELQKPIDEEEKWLVWCVETLLLKLRIHERSRSDRNGTGNINMNVQTMLDELALPLWAVSHNFAAPFEALGTFYAKRGRVEYAMPLYSQAISILMPPESQHSSPEDKCRGAQLMGNVAELVLRNHPSNNVPTEVLAQAEAWARKGLEITSITRKESIIRQHEICEQAYAVLLFNLAMIKQFAGDIDNARTLLYQSLNQAKAIGMQDCISHAQASLGSLPDTKKADGQS